MYAAKISRRGGALLALALVACGGGEGGSAKGKAAAGGPPQQGGAVVLAVKSDFDAMNPVTNSALVTDDVIKFMLFTPLIQFDDKLNPVPYLAERWELTADGVTFHLRRDVKWHDGKPVTAEDVKFTFDLAKNPEAASAMGDVYLQQVKSATVVDPHTIRFEFTAPHAQALDDFWWAPVPKHVLGSTAPGQLAQAPFNRSPVGSGPFKLGQWQAGQQLTLVANEQFSPSLGGRPRLDRAVFRIIPESTTRLQELLSGGVDVNYSVLPDEAQQIQNGGRVELFHYPSREFTYLGWNNERELFRDGNVRRALTMALNREQMIEALMFGYAKPSGSVLPQINPLAPNQPAVPFNLNGAKQLLAQAGWADSNGDGIVEKGGQPFRFTLMTNASNKLFTDLAQVVQSQLRQVGVDAQIQQVEFQTMLRQHRSREYDAIITNWTWDYFKLDPTPLFSCEAAKRPQSANRAGYCNPQVDQTLQQALGTMDAAQARPLWARYAQQLQQDQPVTVLYWAEEIAGVGPRLQGVRMDARSKLVSVREWWMPQAQQRK